MSVIKLSPNTHILPDHLSLFSCYYSLLSLCPAIIIPHTSVVTRFHLYILTFLCALCLYFCTQSPQLCLHQT